MDSRLKTSGMTEGGLKTSGAFNVCKSPCYSVQKSLLQCAKIPATVGTRASACRTFQSGQTKPAVIQITPDGLEARLETAFDQASAHLEHTALHHEIDGGAEVINQHVSVLVK